jgi:ATP-dependent Lhr-like helicase
VSWRLIYRELRRLELRGEVRRGYFVRGLAGAQFATAAAVDALRDAAADTDAPPITMATSDPANVYALPLVVSPEDRPAIARPRGGGAVLVTPPRSRRHCGRRSWTAYHGLRRSHGRRRPPRPPSRLSRI